jgi:hypothetical protein
MSCSCCYSLFPCARPEPSLASDELFVLLQFVSLC